MSVQAQLVPPVSRLLAALLVIPLALAMYAQTKGAAPRPMQSPPPLPALAFEQYLVDLQEVAPSETISARFSFRNASDRKVTITDLEPSCGCLQPQLRKRDYAPGEFGDFALRVQTANQTPGLKDYRVKVKYTDPEPRECELAFRVVLPEVQVFVRPRALVFYQVTGEATEQMLTVTDLRSKPLEIKKVECTSEYVRGEILPPEAAEGEAYQQQVKIIVQGAVPPGRHHALVRMHTDDANYREVRVPLWIFGPESSAPVQQAGHTKPAVTK